MVYIYIFFVSELDKAIDVFRYMQEEDPCRLDNLDTYSNLLYVKDLKTDLANLAHHTVLIDKYRVETCCVVGKFLYFFFFFNKVKKNGQFGV